MDDWMTVRPLVNEEVGHLIVKHQQRLSLTWHASVLDPQIIFRVMIKDNRTILTVWWITEFPAGREPRCHLWELFMLAQKQSQCGSY